MIDLSVIDGISLITPDRLENLVRAIERTADVPGEMAELGVYRGGSAKVISSVCPLKTLHLFDTFAGLPMSETAERDPEGFLPAGHFASDEAEVRAFLEDCNVSFHVGLFPETLEGLLDRRFSFVHVDCDLYESARDAIRYFCPRILDGGIIYFDDYGCKFTGVTEAVDAAFRAELIEKQYDVHGHQIGCLVVK